jgi:PAT family acetyl-CoA transporter-like MFS transporter 1
MANLEIHQTDQSSDTLSTTSITNNDLEPLSPTKKKGFSREDMVGFTILVALYSIQGVPQGFFGRTIHILFIEKGAHNADLAGLALALMPYSFKFLLAPFMDTYYLKKLGKRKTYIIPMQYLFALICFVLAFNLKEEITELKVSPVLLLGFISNTIMAIQDIAVDGWAITILSQENVAYGALAQSIGLMLGGILAFNVFIPLSSIDFCNQYFYSTPQQNAMMSIEGFWIWTGIVTLIITAYVHFFQKEKAATNAEEITSVIEVIKTLKAFVKNVNLRQLVLVTITSSLTTAPIYAIADTKLLQNGFPKEVLTNITTGLIPVQIFGSIFVSRLGKRKMEMKVKTWAYAIAFFNVRVLFEKENLI